MSLVTSTPTSNFVAADVNRLIILRTVFGWSGLTSAATQVISGCPVGTNAAAKIILRWTFGASFSTQRREDTKKTESSLRLRALALKCWNDAIQAQQGYR